MDLTLIIKFDYQTMIIIKELAEEFTEQFTCF